MKPEVKEYLDALGSLAEASLAFYRALIVNGSTEREAYILTMAYISSNFYGRPQTEDNA